MMLEINDDALQMEYTTETVEVEEICDDQNPAKKFKKVVKTYDPKFGTDWKNDPSYKNWVEKPRKDDDPTFQYETTETTECIEIDANGQKHQTIEVKNVRKPGPSNVTPAKNNRAVKRQIKVMDPNLPAFVCTEHNENISLDCRYCRIASGFKKKSAPKNVQNDEISSSGKVTVAIPKPNATLLQPKNLTDGIFIEAPSDSLSGSCVTDPSTFLQKNPTQGVGFVANKVGNKTEEKDCKEDIFGRYIASELKRIKSKKTYEEVKWKILQALQAAAEKETDDSEPSLP